MAEAVVKAGPRARDGENAPGLGQGQHQRGGAGEDAGAGRASAPWPSTAAPAPRCTAVRPTGTTIRAGEGGGVHPGHRQRRHLFGRRTPSAFLQFTGADMAMIGRGCFGNPWLFQQAQAALEGRPIPPLPPLAERCDTAVRQIRTGRCGQGRAHRPAGGPEAAMPGISRACPTPTTTKNRSSA